MTVCGAPVRPLWHRVAKGGEGVEGFEPGLYAAVGIVIWGIFLVTWGKRLVRRALKRLLRRHIS